ncbi:glycoside hydrolase [Auricularia subglabra TFB-10046 SS5]|nr:glycoside hydrolase [Auricularia subglabra TFB-10046 SS5]
MKTSFLALTALVTAARAAPANKTHEVAPAGNVTATLVHGPPYFSVYADVGITTTTWPSAAQLGKWNDFVIAFWLARTNGPFDTAAVWASFVPETRQFILDQYHAAGKTIRVTLFGSTDFPLQIGANPVTIANEVAAFVKNNQLDGVDIDYEDSPSFENPNGGGEQFLITLTTALRQQLPAGQYIISHAPQAPYFTTDGRYPNGAYLTVHRQVGNLIDFYNVQYYNQGPGLYESCATTLTSSSGSIAGTSVADIIRSGVPASKIVVGKPGIVPDDANNGFIPPATLGQCISALSPAAKPGGVMAWQWIHAQADWIAAASGNL